MSSQCMEALEKANEVRGRHATYRRHVAAMTTVDGAHYLADVLEAHADGEPVALEDATVAYSLSAIRRVRATRAEALIAAAGITRKWTRTSGTKLNRLLRVGELTANEATSLAGVLRDTYPRVPEASR